MYQTRCKRQKHSNVSNKLDDDLIPCSPPQQPPFSSTAHQRRQYNGNNDHHNVYCKCRIAKVQPWAYAHFWLTNCIARSRWSTTRPICIRHRLVHCTVNISIQLHWSTLHLPDAIAPNFQQASSIDKFAWNIAILIQWRTTRGQDCDCSYMKWTMFVAPVTLSTRHQAVVHSLALDFATNTTQLYK